MDEANILLVCTGNVCRSPAAGLLLADRLGQAAQHYWISSAGIKAAAGSPIDPSMRELLARRGIQATDALARQLTVGMLESADLILTASTNQRAAAVRMLPPVVRRTLTLNQLARYAPIILQSGAMPTSSKACVQWILAALPHARAQAPQGSDSIADPIGKSRRHYRVAIDQLDHACTTIASILRGTDATATSPDSWWLEMSAVEVQDRTAHI